MMEELMHFITIYGWQLSLIAILGIIILGILKYANVFSKIEKVKRKPIYFAISVGFSILATIIYLAIMGRFEIGYIVGVSTAIYGLNQVFYTIYENTSLRDLMIKLLDLIKAKIKGGQ